MRDCASGQVLITAQNHNYAVALDSLDPTRVEATHLSLNDGTLEGMRLKDRPVFSVQFHPEAAPGPHDAHGLFNRFFDLMREVSHAARVLICDSILVIPGSGPIVIGQAAEFDYSGTQAVKALRAEGYRIILVNSNPATVMTDPDLADATYIEPLNLEALEAIIAQEQPDALLPTVGGQTALNLALALSESGILQRYGVEMIGARLDSIRIAEDRDLFRETCWRADLPVPRGGPARLTGRGGGHWPPGCATRSWCAPRLPWAAPAPRGSTSPAELPEALQRRPVRIAHPPGLAGRIDPRLERISSSK